MEQENGQSMSRFQLQTARLYTCEKLLKKKMKHEKNARNGAFPTFVDELKNWKRTSSWQSIWERVRVDEDKLDSRLRQGN